MATAVPANQLVERKLATKINERFVDVAEALTPQLHEWIEHPLEVVSFEPDPSSYFGCRTHHKHTLEELRSLQWGRGDEFILDFGSHRAGYFSFHLSAEGLNIDAPVRLKLTFGEVPYDVTEDLHPCNTWISTSWIPDETINVDWCPSDVDMPRRYSFRYVRVQILDTSPKFKVLFSNIQVRAVSAISPTQSIEPASFDDDIWTQMDKVSMVTLRDCMQTVFEDGPRRDRRLWSGDLRLQALTNYCTFKNYPLVKRCLYMFAALPREDGSLPSCVFEKPKLTPASDYIVDYDALFGSIVYDYAQASGDLETAEDLWETVLNSMKMALSHVSPEGKFSSEGPGWKFLDWAKDLDTNAGMHGLTLYCCKAVNSLAKLLNKEQPYTSIISKMTTSARDFFDPTQRVFVSGPSAQVSWASQAWMALAGALPPADCKTALLNVMASKTAVKPLTPYLFHHVAEALAVSGAEKECLDLMRYYWGGMLQAGADTFWECFDPENSRASPYGDCHNNSYCHAWSCTPSYLLRRVLRDYLRKGS
jgi:alpha-L-rhamnosidase